MQVVECKYTTRAEKIRIFIAGESWQDKIGRVRDSLKTSGHDAIILTALDEIAWLFNMRGKDIPYNPVFRAYAVVSQDQIILYIPEEKQTEDVKSHLNSEVPIFVSNY